MDENYLDNLLNEISLDNEIDEELERSKQNRAVELREDAFDHAVSQDSNPHLSAGDDILGESAFDELDELDRMADMDISDLDFADLDFDDLDMLETTPGQESQVTHASPMEPEHSASDSPAEGSMADLSIDDMFFGQPAQEAQQTQQMEQPFMETMPSPAEEPVEMQPDLSAADTGGLGGSDPDADLNDLFEMLGIEDEEETGAQPSDGGVQAASGEGEPDGFSENLNDFLDESVSEVDNTSSEKPKRSFLQFLFGPDDDDDEDEPSEEELAAIQAEKQAKKDARKAEKQAKADEKKAVKAARDAEINADKAAKKALKAAKKKEAEAALPPEKALNKTAVTVIMAFFAILTAVIILGTNTFNYALVVRKAADYFSRQKYHMAYDEIAGVEVKEKDKELKDKIYTVMYVERLYESYEIDAKLGRMNKGLDSLLRGLTKYDEHYAEAQELNIVQDINYSRDKIISALLSTYGLTVDDAYAILALDSYAYRTRLEQYGGNLGDDSVILNGTSEETPENSSEEQQ